MTPQQIQTQLPDKRLQILFYLALAKNNNTKIEKPELLEYAADNPNHAAKIPAQNLFILAFPHFAAAGLTHNRKQTQKILNTFTGHYIHYSPTQFERFPQAPLFVPKQYNWKPQYNTTTIKAIANNIYQNKDYTLMPILADALQDEGCNDEIMLEYMRNPKSSFFKGDFILDKAIGKR